MKDNDKNKFSVPEKSTFKKKYLVRKHQEQEAEEEIKQYENSSNECFPDEDQRDRLGRS